jgi:hypothetical protein
MSFEEKGQWLNSQQGPLFGNLLATTLEYPFLLPETGPLDLRYCFLSLKSNLKCHPNKCSFCQQGNSFATYCGLHPWWKLIRESWNSRLIVVWCLSRKPTMVNRCRNNCSSTFLFALFPVSLNHWSCLNCCPWLQSTKAVTPSVLIDCMCKFQKQFITQMKQKGVC